jgi:hypothetical protein
VHTPVVVVHTGVIGSAEKDVVKPYAHAPDRKAWAKQYRISTESTTSVPLHKDDTVDTALFKLKTSSLQVSYFWCLIQMSHMPSISRAALHTLHSDLATYDRVHVSDLSSQSAVRATGLNDRIVQAPTMYGSSMSILLQFLYDNVDSTSGSVGNLQLQLIP